MIEPYVLGLEEIDKTQVALVGGKGANLGELSRIEGIRVPPGFCVTTDAFRLIMTTVPEIGDQLGRLSRLDPGDRQAIRTISAEIRRALEGIAIPDDRGGGDHPLGHPAWRASCLRRPVQRHGGGLAVGLLRGPAGHVPQHCGVGCDPPARQPMLGLPVHRACRDLPPAERLRPPEGPHGRGRAADALPAGGRHPLTADPVTSNRKVVSIEASFGLGEALVSGLVNADVYKVRDGEVVAKVVATKQLAIHALAAGGTQELAIEPASQTQSALTDAQIVRLAQLGRRIEAHFGHPQDIEWCLVDGGFQIVQSRPITTLFPIPATSDQENHVYVSVGHQQMMTDPMKPLGVSMWQLTAARPM